MIFKTCTQFLDELVKHNLYCAKLSMFLFTYNDGASIAQYYIDNDEAKELAQMASKTGEYWEAFLSTGGHIYDGEDGLELLEEYKAYNWIPTYAVRFG